jgi:hypothetical protein
MLTSEIIGTFPAHFRAAGFLFPQGVRGTRKSLRPGGFFLKIHSEDYMNDEEKMTKEQWIMHKQWRERCDERDNQALIRLTNLALWTAFTICEGGK